MKFNNVKLLSQTAGAGDTTTQIQVLEYIFGFSYQIVGTATLTGTLKFYCSNQDVKDTSLITDWAYISGADLTLIAGADLMQTFHDTYYKYIKAVFTNTGGAGKVTIYFASKGL